MRIEQNKFWIAESQSDLNGWNIQFIEEFKPGVKRLHCQRAVGTAIELRMIYWNIEKLGDLISI